MCLRSRSTVMSVVPIARFTVPLDENGFVDWLIDSFPGDKVVYYRGLLAHDRTPSAKVLAPRPRSDLVAVARRVLTMASHGLVHPLQKRMGPNDFLYIAVRTKPRGTAGAVGVSAATPFPIASRKPNASEPALVAFAA
jgi:hypothetical protein